MLGVSFPEEVNRVLVELDSNSWSESVPLVSQFGCDM